MFTSERFLTHLSRIEFPANYCTCTSICVKFKFTQQLRAIVFLWKTFVRHKWLFGKTCSGHQMIWISRNNLQSHQPCIFRPTTAIRRSRILECFSRETEKEDDDDDVDCELIVCLPNDIECSVLFYRNWFLYRLREETAMPFFFPNGMKNVVVAERIGFFSAFKQMQSFDGTVHFSSHAESNETFTFALYDICIRISNGKRILLRRNLLCYCCV